MSSKASRILGIEEEDNSNNITPRTSTDQRHFHLRSPFASSHAKTSRFSPPPVPSNASPPPAPHFPIRTRTVRRPLDEYDVDMDSEEILRKDKTHSMLSTTSNKAAQLLGVKVDSPQHARMLSPTSDKAAQILGVELGSPIHTRKRSSHVDPLFSDTALPHRLDAPSNTVTSFNATLSDGLASAYPLTQQDIEDPEVFSQPRKVPPALPLEQRPSLSHAAQARLSVMSVGPTSPVPELPLPQTPKVPLALIVATRLNTFRTGTRLYMHGQTRLKNKRRSASINTLAGWGWEDEESAHEMYINAEEVVAEMTATYFLRTFSRMYGESSTGDCVIDELWSKEWLAAPVLDAVLIQRCKTRQEEVIAEEYGLGNDRPVSMHRRNTSSSSGRRMSSMLSPGIMRSRLSSAASTRRKSWMSGKSVGSTGAPAGVFAGLSPMRKSFDRKASKTPQGLKELWFRRGLV